MTKGQEGEGRELTRPERDVLRDRENRQGIVALELEGLAVTAAFADNETLEAALARVMHFFPDPDDVRGTLSNAALVDPEWKP